MTRVHEVKIRPIPAKPKLADRVLSICSFCGRKDWIAPEKFQQHADLAHGKYHCAFCLRHGHHYKDARNILLLNFLGIIGYYYHNLYDVEPRKMWLSQIARYVDLHESIGVKNPVFSYDRETGMWFINFNRVGKGKHEVSVEQIHATIREIVAIMEVDKRIVAGNEHQIIRKYVEAIDLYYTQRQYPHDKLALSPTMKGCVQSNIKDFETTKNFSLSVVLDSSPMTNMPKIMEADIETINDLETWSLKSLQVIVKAKKADGVAGFEGIVSIPNLKSSKIARKDGSTFFTTLSGLRSVARGFAKRLSCALDLVEPPKKAMKAVKGMESRTNTQD